MKKCKNCKHLTTRFEISIGKATEYNWCPVHDNCPDVEVERDCIEYECMTNADIIRRMSDEQLAELMDDTGDFFLCDICEFREPNENGEGCLGRGCKDYILKWLKQEVEIEHCDRLE